MGLVLVMREVKENNLQIFTCFQILDLLLYFSIECQTELQKKGYFKTYIFLFSWILFYLNVSCKTCLEISLKDYYKRSSIFFALPIFFPRIRIGHVICINDCSTPIESENRHSHLTRIVNETPSYIDI